jgi:hypothetical protein
MAILTGSFVEDSLMRLARNALPTTAQLFLDDLFFNKKTRKYTFQNSERTLDDVLDWENDSDGVV